MADTPVSFAAVWDFIIGVLGTPCYVRRQRGGVDRKIMRQMEKGLDVGKRTLQNSWREMQAEIMRHQAERERYVREGFDGAVISREAGIIKQHQTAQQEVLASISLIDSVKTELLCYLASLSASTATSEQYRSVHANIQRLGRDVAGFGLVSQELTANLNYLRTAHDVAVKGVIEQEPVEGYDDEPVENSHGQPPRGPYDPPVPVETTNSSLAAQTSTLPPALTSTSDQPTLVPEALPRAAPQTRRAPDRVLTDDEVFMKSLPLVPRGFDRPIGKRTAKDSSQKHASMLAL